MVSPKIRNIVSILHQNLAAADFPHALIGAMALSLYGMPRYTADIDMLADETNRNAILQIMTRLGYECFQNADSFAQFDSALGVYGKVDFMFAQTKTGRAILEKAALVNDEFLGEIPVIQPTDYAVLKLMAIANNPERKNQDKADLQALFKTVAMGFVHRDFNDIDIEKLRQFALQFGLSEFLEKLLPLLGDQQ